MRETVSHLANSTACWKVLALKLSQKVIQSRVFNIREFYVYDLMGWW